MRAGMTSEPPESMEQRREAGRPIAVYLVWLTARPAGQYVAEGRASHAGVLRMESTVGSGDER